MDIYFFGCFPVAEMRKKKIMCVKNEKKKRKKKRGAAETDFGYCPDWVTIQWNLYRDTVALGV